MFCRKCGVNVSEDSCFCQSCGSKITPISANDKPPIIAAQDSANTCPKCGSDRITKYSVYSEKKKSGNGSGAEAVDHGRAGHNFED